MRDAFVRASGGIALAGDHRSKAQQLLSTESQASVLVPASKAVTHHLYESGPGGNRLRGLIREGFSQIVTGNAKARGSV
jgi:hypothetical protein